MAHNSSDARSWNLFLVLFLLVGCAVLFTGAAAAPEVQNVHLAVNPGVVGLNGYEVTILCASWPCQRCKCHLCHVRPEHNGAG